MKFLQKIKYWKAILYIFQSIYFNLKYLPIKQAIRMPILLYKPTFMGLKGKIIIEGKVSFGMITMGFYRVPMYSNDGIKFQNSGLIVFRGPCNIGNSSVISVGKIATLTFGTDFNATCGFKCICHYRIQFGERCLVGWDSIFMDTDWHTLSNVSGGNTKGFGKIEIGNDVWFANGCRVYKNSVIPNFTTITANTVISCPVNTLEYSVIGQKKEISVLRSGVWHNMAEDKIIYQ